MYIKLSSMGGVSAGPEFVVGEFIFIARKKFVFFPAKFLSSLSIFRRGR